MDKKLHQNIIKGSTEEHQKLVSDFMLEFCRLDLGRIFPRQTGVARSMDLKRVIRYGLKGGADCWFILKSGIHGEAEMKTGNAKQKKDQKNFEKMITDHNGIYIVVRQVDQAIKEVIIQAARKRPI